MIFRDVNLWVYAFRKDSPLHEKAWGFVDVLETHENAHFVEFGQTTYGIFKHLALVTGGEVNLIPEAFLAALSIRQDCRFVTADRGFQKYPGLQVEFVG